MRSARSLAVGNSDLGRSPTRRLQALAKFHLATCVWDRTLRRLDLHGIA